MIKRARTNPQSRGAKAGARGPRSVLARLGAARLGVARLGVARLGVAMALSAALGGAARAQGPAVDDMAQRLPDWARPMIGAANVRQVVDHARYRRIIWIHESTQSARALARHLRPPAGDAAANLVRHHTARGWQIVSGWSSGALTTVQWRPRAGGSLVVTSWLAPVADFRAGPGPAKDLPGWLTFLPNPWTQRLTIAGHQVTTVASQALLPLATVHRQLVANALRSGLKTVADGVAAGEAVVAGSQASRLLLFKGPGQEALVTLLGGPRETEVVVHLRERQP